MSPSRACARLAVLYHHHLNMRTFPPGSTLTAPGAWQQCPSQRPACQSSVFRSVSPGAAVTSAAISERRTHGGTALSPLRCVRFQIQLSAPCGGAQCVDRFVGVM